MKEGKTEHRSVQLTLADEQRQLDMGRRKEEGRPGADLVPSALPCHLSCSSAFRDLEQDVDVRAKGMERCVPLILFSLTCPARRHDRLRASSPCQAHPPPLLSLPFLFTTHRLALASSTYIRATGKKNKSEDPETSYVLSFLGSALAWPRRELIESTDGLSMTCAAMGVKSCPSSSSDSS